VVFAQTCYLVLLSLNTFPVNSDIFSVILWERREPQQDREGAPIGMRSFGAYSEL
jgi:hypothetical protein